MKTFLAKYKNVLIAISVIAAALAGYAAGTADLGATVSLIFHAVFG